MPESDGVAEDESVGLMMVELEGTTEETTTEEVAAVNTERTAVGRLTAQSVVDAENVEGEYVDMDTVSVLESAIGT